MATNTYVALDKVTVGTAAPSVTLSSIPQGYTDLVIVINGAASSGSTNTLKVNYNGDTTSGLYSHTRLLGDGSSASSARQSNANWAGAGDTGSDRAVFIINVQNYSNATTYKTHISRSNSENYVSSYTGLWRNTAAITSVTLGINTLQWAVGTTVSLYGIAAQAVATTAKATGGTITYDAFGNVIHTFTSSGTFTPSANLTCDYLVIAGGGAGGGANNGGGGGAGGYLTGSTTAANGTGYTVTIGAGGTGTRTSTPVNGNNSVFGAITATGGGGGGGYFDAGASGGSGGGNGFGATSAGAAGTAGQGYAGGSANGNIAPYTGGGGGGSSSAGTTGTTTGNGGSATTSGISGSLVAYAGGGGGGSNGTAGVGGGGGAGQGAVSGRAAENGSANTGSGGGGCQTSQTLGGSGGSGIVIIRYPGL